MKYYYTIPHQSLTGDTHRQTIEKAIQLLSNQYMIDWEVMTESKRIELLEIIANLTHVYFDMSMGEAKT